jgi:hypothetical protein
MMDIFTIILLFLLTFFDPSSADAGPQLPGSEATAAVEEGPRLRVLPAGIDLDGRRILPLADGAVLPAVERDGRALMALLGPLQQARSRAGGALADAPTEEPVLVLEVDRAVPYAIVGDVLLTAGQAGWGRFRFVVARESR